MTKNNSSNNQVIDTGFFTIKGNILLSDNIFIQMSNITRVWTGQLPKKPLPLIPVIILIIAGIILFDIKIWLAILAIIIAGIIIFVNVKQTVYHGINIELNSGNIYSFICDDPSYVKKAFDCLSQCIYNKTNYNKYYKINLNNGVINSGVINSGNIESSTVAGEINNNV